MRQPALLFACGYGVRRMLALAVSLAWPFMLPDVALAQVRPDAGRIERDFERDRVPSAPPPKPAVPVFDEGQRPAMAAPDNVSFPVSGFRITRNTVFPEAELQALLKNFVGRELSLADLQRASDVITAYYRERGYFVARAYVPAQDIRDGIVEIMVLEGKLDGISLKPATELRLQPETVERTLRAALPSWGSDSRSRPRARLAAAQRPAGPHGPLGDFPRYHARYLDHYRRSERRAAGHRFARCR